MQPVEFFMYKSAGLGFKLYILMQLIAKIFTRIISTKGILKIPRWLPRRMWSK